MQGLRFDESYTASIVTEIDPVTKLQYIGYAEPGTANTAAGRASASWVIKRIDYTTGQVITWASGNRSDFKLVWDNRATYTYTY